MASSTLFPMAALIPIALDETNNLNDLPLSGIYGWGASRPLNIPMTRDGLLIQLRRSSTHRVQICVCTDSGSPRLFIRVYTSTWSAWKEATLS